MRRQHGHQRVADVDHGRLGVKAQPVVGDRPEPAPDDQARAIGRDRDGLDLRGIGTGEGQIERRIDHCGQRVELGENVVRPSTNRGEVAADEQAPRSVGELVNLHINSRRYKGRVDRTCRQVEECHAAAVAHDAIGPGDLAEPAGDIDLVRRRSFSYRQYVIVEDHLRADERLGVDVPGGEIGPIDRHAVGPQHLQEVTPGDDVSPGLVGGVHLTAGGETSAKVDQRRVQNDRVALGRGGRHHGGMVTKRRIGSPGRHPHYGRQHHRAECDFEPIRELHANLRCCDRIQNAPSSAHRAVRPLSVAFHHSDGATDGRVRLIGPHPGAHSRAWRGNHDRLVRRHRPGQSERGDHHRRDADRMCHPLGHGPFHASTMGSCTT